MKKNLFYYLFAVICSVTLFTACSDDDEDTTWQQIPEITNDNVTLKLNDKTPAGATVGFKFINGENGELTLNNAIYGHDMVKVDVSLQKKDETSYTFSGTADLEAARLTSISDGALKVTVSGTINTAGEMTVDVITSGWAAVSGVYANDSLSMTLNGEAHSSKFAVTLTVTAEDKATLVFDKIVNVAAGFEMDVTLENGKIEGNKEKEAGYLISVSGALTDGKLTLAVITSGWGTVSGSYYGNGENKLIYHADEDKEWPSGASIGIKMTSENKADITFSNLLSGSRTGELKGVDVTSKDGVYTFKGGKTNAYGYDLIFDGTFTAGALTAKVTYKTNSTLVGTWVPKMNNGLVQIGGQFRTHNGSVTFPKELIAMLPEELKPMFPETMSDEALLQVLQGLLGKYASFLKSVTFTEGGRLIATYVDMPKDMNGDGVIDENDMVNVEEKNFSLLQYYPDPFASGSKFYLTVSIMDLMGMIPQSAPRTWNPGTLLTEGAPLCYKASEDTASIAITDEVLNAQTIQMINEMLQMFGPMIPGFAEQQEMINAVMGALNSILGDVSELNIEILFEKK